MRGLGLSLHVGDHFVDQVDQFSDLPLLDFEQCILFSVLYHQRFHSLFHPIPPAIWGSRLLVISFRQVIDCSNGFSSGSLLACSSGACRGSSFSCFFLWFSPLFLFGLLHLLNYLRSNYVERPPYSLSPSAFLCLSLVSVSDVVSASFELPLESVLIFFIASLMIFAYKSPRPSPVVEMYRHPVGCDVGTALPSGLGVAGINRTRRLAEGFYG